MRKFYFLIWLGVAACTQQPADRFVLRGTVPGAMDSTKVTLRPADRWDRELATAYVVGGKFELCGKLDAPTLCKLSLDNVDYIRRSGLPLRRRILTVCRRHTGFMISGKKRITG